MPMMARNDLGAVIQKHMKGSKSEHFTKENSP